MASPIEKQTKAAWLVCVAMLSFYAVDARSESLPRLEGETLSKKPIVLPDEAHAKIALLVIGFSKKGGQATGVWERQFKNDFGSDQRYAVYPVAVLEDVPRFVRGMVTSGIRSGSPPGERDHFVTLFHGEQDLKRLVTYSAPDDAYILLLDPTGEIRWRGHGLFNDKDYAALKNVAKQLAAR
jgi:ATP10 protein